MLNPNFLVAAASGIGDPDFMDALQKMQRAQQSRQGLGFIPQPTFDPIPEFKQRGLSFADVANALGIAFNSQQGAQMRAGAQQGIQRLDVNNQRANEVARARVQQSNANKQSDYLNRVRAAMETARLDQASAEKAADRLNSKMNNIRNNDRMLANAQLSSQTRLKTAADLNAFRIAAANIASKDKNLDTLLKAIGDPDVSVSNKVSIGRHIREQYGLFKDLTDQDLAQLSPSQLSRNRALDQADERLRQSGRGLDLRELGLRSTLELNKARLEQLAEVTRLLPIKAQREWESMLTGRMNAESRIAALSNMSPLDIKRALDIVTSQKFLLNAQLFTTSDPAARRTMLDALDQLGDREKELNQMIIGGKVNPDSIRKASGTDVPPMNPFQGAITPNGVKGAIIQKPATSPVSPQEARRIALINEAKKAIAAGADPNKVKARLKKLGISM